MEKPNVEVLRVLYSKRKPILVTTLVATLLAFAVTFIVTPKYRSMAYVYPANMVPFFMEQENKAVSHTELLLQFFKSNDVREQLLKKHQLAKHWDLDPTDPKFKTRFNDLFEERVLSNLTRFESIELSVTDVNRDTAQKIAASLIEEVNHLISKQHIEKFNEFIAVNRAYLAEHRRALDSLQAAMEVFAKKYHIIDMNTQLKYASLNYYKLMAEGKENAKITASVNEITEHGPELIRFNNALQEQSRLYATVENDLSKAVRDFNRKLSYVIVASSPNKPDVKYWPKRGAISLITALSFLMLSSLYFVFIRRIKEVIESIKTPPAMNH